MATKEELIELLDAGLHFGHQTQRWNPKMKQYIFGAKNGIYILDLRKTADLLDAACEAVRQAAAKGKNIVFVGTKKQANEVVKEEALRAGSYYVNRRWLGGMITNYETIRGRINKLRELESFMESGHTSKLPKKEVVQLNRQLAKLSKTLGGIKDMKGMPDMLFVVDQRKELIAIKEAKMSKIPVICLADTNADPDDINYIIPGNDDAIRSIKLVASRLADAILEGKEMRANKIDTNKAKLEKIEAKDANVEPVEEKVEKIQAEDVGINLDELK